MAAVNAFKENYWADRQDRKMVTKRRKRSITRIIRDKLNPGKPAAPVDQVANKEDEAAANAGNPQGAAKNTNTAPKEKGKTTEISGEGLDGQRPRINLNFDGILEAGPEEKKKEEKPLTPEQQKREDERQISIINRVMSGASAAATRFANFLAGFMNWHIAPENWASAVESMRDIFYIVFPEGMPTRWALPLLFTDFLSNFTPKPQKMLPALPEVPETKTDEQK